MGLTVAGAPHPVPQVLSSVEWEDGRPMQHHLTDQPKCDETMSQSNNL